ncbi:MAG: Tim44/TimA family putative adaptor protein [Alphaproteobacteria bacterium]
MSGLFDIYSIIFLVIAVVIFMRLGSVLGRRTGNEPTPFERRIEKSPPASGNDNVVPLPTRDGVSAAAGGSAVNAEALAKHAEPGTTAHDGMTAISAATGDFDPDHFLTGAKMAYEMIVTAFADGDRATLKNLLDKEVYDGFVSAIDDRESRKEHVESTFVGIDSAKISAAELEDRTARVGVRFVSELISATKNDDGAVIEGDPSAVQTVRDVWTFARDLRTNDPNWKLVATEAV